MKRVLIAVGLEIFGDQVAAFLCEGFDVRVCCRSEQIRPICEQWHPDVMVIDLTLAGINHRSILRMDTVQNKAFVLLTSFLDKDFLAEAEQKRNIHILRIPCSANTVANHLKQLLSCQNG